MSCEIYTTYAGDDGMLLSRTRKLTIWKSKSSLLSYNLVCTFLFASIISNRSDVSLFMWYDCCMLEKILWVLGKSTFGVYSENDIMFYAGEMTF